MEKEEMKNKNYSKWDESFMMTAKLVGDRHATCARVKVGCVIAKDRRIVSIGYNGVASKQEHCVDKFTKMIVPQDQHTEDQYTNLYDVLRTAKVHEFHDMIGLNGYNVRIFDRPMRDREAKVIFEWILSIDVAYQAYVGNNKPLLERIEEVKEEFFNSDAFKTLHREWSIDNELHAEQNAIGFAAKNGIDISGASLYCTITPCRYCAKLIVSSGIKRVFYGAVYDREDTRDYFKQNNIETTQIKI